MYGLRNKIVHDYEGVNLVLIWDIISEDLPELYVQPQELYQRNVNEKEKTDSQKRARFYTIERSQLQLQDGITFNSNYSIYYYY